MKRYIIALLVIIILFLYLLIKEKKRENFTYYKGYEYSDNISVKQIINLKKGQVKMTNLLREFDRICRKHNLKYWCIGGTLIGVLRHKGWIPFDGDIDIGITDTDYEIFKNVVDKELPSFIKFSHLPKNKPCSKLSDITAKYKYTKFGKNWDVNKNIMLDIFIFNTNNPDKFYGDSPRKNFKKEIILPLKEKMFEDVKVYIPNDSETYLKLVGYENYMKHPNKEKRFPHEGFIEILE